MTEDDLCPFSKPIIGQWCQCPHARLYDRCSGKMVCKQADQYRQGCLVLVDLLKEKSRFILGLPVEPGELTHAQLMKIRCGGLSGMQRVLDLDRSSPPVVLEVISTAEQRYRGLAHFPFGDIVKDIQNFSHRKKAASPMRDS